MSEKEMKLTQAEEHEAFETSHSEVQAIMEKYDRESVTRHLKGPLKWIVFALCILFSCVQLYAAFTANIPATQLRPLHLGFVMMLVFLIFPVTKKARRDVLPFYDVILSLAGMGVCLTMAEEMGAYILTDKATFLTFVANDGVMD